MMTVMTEGLIPAILNTAKQSLVSYIKNLVLSIFPDFLYIKNIKF